MGGQRCEHCGGLLRRWEGKVCGACVALIREMLSQAKENVEEDAA